MKFEFPLLLAIFLSACTTATKVDVSPDAERIQIVTGEPDQQKCKYLGEVVGEAKAGDIADAQKFARNDMKNKALASGGNLVKLDTNTAANAMDYSGRNKIVLNGRVFACK